jgi:hypothetical protein
MKEILSVLHYCVCDLRGQGPYRRSTPLFGGVSLVRICVVVFSCERDEYAERFYVVIHNAFGANPLCLWNSHP